MNGRPKLENGRSALNGGLWAVGVQSGRPAEVPGSAGMRSHL